MNEQQMAAARTDEILDIVPSHVAFRPIHPGSSERHTVGSPRSHTVLHVMAVIDGVERILHFHLDPADDLRLVAEGADAALIGQKARARADERSAAFTASLRASATTE